MAGSQDGQPGFRRLTQGELANLAPMLNLEKVPDPIAERLRESISNYTHDNGRTTDVPQVDGSGSNLEAFNRQAAALQGIITTLEPVDLEAIAACEPGLRDILESMPAQLARVAAASAEAIKTAKRHRPGKPGSAPGQSPLHRLIHRLMVIFEGETGKEAGNSWNPVTDTYLGPFFDFTKAVIDIATPEDNLNNRELGSQITRALASAKQLYGDFLIRSHGRLPLIKPDLYRK